MENQISIKEAYFNMIDSITNSNQEILSKFRECIENPMEYYKKNYSSFQERGINEYTTENEIQFWTMLKLLIENDYCCELDWKDCIDEFIYAIENLKNTKPFNNENLEEQDNVFIWCDTINKEWEKQDRCIAEIVIGSDSYVLFICSYKQLDYISSLAKYCNCKILKIEYDEQEEEKARNVFASYYIYHFNSIILDIEKNKKVNFFGVKTKQQLYDSYAMFALLVPVIIAIIIMMRGTIISMILGLIISWSGLWGILPLTFIIGKKIAISRFYKKENGEYDFNLIEFPNETVLDQLKEKDAIIIYESQSSVMLNFIYNWLNNNDLLKDKKINAYIFDRKYFCKKCKVKIFTDSQKLLYISFKDLNITPKNIEAIRDAHKYMKVLTLKQIIEKYSKKNKEKDEKNEI